MNGQVANGSGVTFSVLGNCAAIKSGLYQQNGADIGNNVPVSGSGGITSNGDAGTFSTAKATYQVVVGPTGINGISGYVVDYKVTITSLAVGETGGADSFTMYYAPGSDTNSNIYGNATTPFTVNITNLPANGPTATQSSATNTLTQNQPSANFAPVTGSGGAAPLTYGVSPSLPAGLTFNTSTGAITGSPTATSSATTYTVTVTDANSATASNTFSLTVNPAVTATQSVASKTLTQNQLAASFTPVTGGNGTPSLSYSVSPSLPSGLTLNTSTGAITGTPTAISGPTTYTITVTDSKSATASNTFSLTVNSAVTATQSVASKALTVNHAASAFTPVTGGGGTGTLAYSISPSLPTGLSLNGSSGAISGTPTVTAATATYTVTVTDSNNATATNTFSLTVNGAVSATQSVASATLSVNHAVTSFTPVIGGNGTSPLTYGISPSLPAGLSFNSSTGAITGTPTATSATATYTVTVTDANSATASNTFSLTVNAAVSATQVIPSKGLTVNVAAASFTPVTGSGGRPPLSYGVAPALPAGLSFNTSTGAITGTPTATSGATTYTVTVTDANSATATATFSLTVNGGVSATQAIASKTITANQAVTAFTPVTGSGGTAPLAFSVSPALPVGLTLNTSDGSITGTPTAASGATTYTVTVTDAANATATNTFSLTVNAAVTATTAVPSSALPINQAVTPFTPVTGSGGTGALAFAISPTLPTGLNFNTTNGLVSGTPTVPSATTTYTVTVSDANSASANATFNLSVGQLATTVALTSSQNPSQFGQTVTFTATMNPTAATGTVTFNDNGAAIGTAALAGGVATFTTTTLAVGSHTITASYGGSAFYTASTSPGLAQTVNVPVDSVRLRSLQQTVSKLVAQNSGQAISGAIDDAIADGFNDGGSFVTPGAGRMRFNFSADPRDQDETSSAAGRTGESNAYAGARGRASRGRIDDAFAAIDRGAQKQAPPKWHQQKEWLLWADIRGSGVDRWGTTTASGVAQASQTPLYGQQINALMGLTYRAAPTLLVGVVGGYETFSYTQQDINGRLKGEGWTTGAYLGWKIVPTLRFDASMAYSGIGYNGTAGTAQGNFNGQRWMVSGGLTGNFQWAGMQLEPSAKVYALWEHQNAYVDTLGTQQGTNNFASGRASGGLRSAYPFPWLDSGIQLIPYLGIYGDYYFNKDDTAVAAGTGLASTPLLYGWSARATGGLGIRIPGGGGLGLGAEFGGLGSSTHIWTFAAKAQVPF